MITLNKEQEQSIQRSIDNWIRHKKLRETNLTDHMAVNLACGIHSGIPICCIAYFVSEWIHFDNKTRYKRIRNFRKLKLKVDYVPCPNCLTSRRFVKKLRQCSCPWGSKKKEK